ncbi:MAG: hypothetical protein R3E79_60655 [Caldilineaceae bacterium]
MWSRRSSTNWCAAAPNALALSEDDHLELLVNLAQDRGKENADRLPALVRGALFDDVIAWFPAG